LPRYILCDIVQNYERFGEHYPRGLAIAELFRLKNGKIIEHWDVVQPVPQQTASGNSMF